MHKKAVIIIAIIVGVLIIASGVVGTIVALNHNKNESAQTTPAPKGSSDATKQEEQTTPDLSVDLGACSSIPFATITKALKPPVVDVRDAKNLGFGYEKNGNRSQSCAYPFSENNNQSNRFTLTITEFSTDENKSNAVKGFEDYTAVSGIGEKAGFTSYQDAAVTKQNSYSLFVIIDQKQYGFTILQPNDSDAFTVTTAQKALEEIAQSL